jgi:hypothetical protein
MTIEKRIFNALSHLTIDEGESVTVHCANADFNGPEHIIECCGDWTGFRNLRVGGCSLIECLEKAWQMKEDNKELN